MKELDKSYDASKYEADIYQKWMDSGYFNPDNLPASDDNAEPFTIVLPPPNVTGTLHLGHAFEDTIQDILIRYRRMQGRKTLWLPGTDHAAIATQTKVEKILEKEGTRKSELGREKFLERVEAFAQGSHDTIISQLKAMGASLDWSREAYTMDEARSLAVRTAFKAMYDDGLIYRGHKVINWDPKGQTVISDEEIVHQERDSVLYTFKYSADFPIPISTTRPETKIGDTAVAVHPDDERYAEFVGKEYDLEFAGVPLHIKVVADEAVEKDFGTGALGVTPAHSLIDAEIAERHRLPMKQVINEFAKMSIGGELLEGKKVAEAREIIVNWLREQNLIISEEPIKQSIATAERSGGVIEPLPKLQWFLAVNKPFLMKNSQIDGIKTGQEITLKELMRHVISTNQIGIVPEHFSKTYFHWVDNLRDWCISRQLWFGHRIPVWYKGSAANPEEIYSGVSAPDGSDWTQDEDTLDTWFSSGLWTFSTLGWPNEIADLKTFHPTSVIVPGYEILFFWVARMILMTGYHLGTIPFKDIYLHGIVRDKDGKKFSKSANNGIDPLEMAEKYGTDALRFALVFNAAPGNDTLFDEQKVKGMKHFGNKLWNIARFVLANVDEVNLDEPINAITEADISILNQLTQTTQKVDSALDSFRIHEATQSLYDFVWRDFADVYIEASKLQLQDEAQKANTEKILVHNLIQILKLLHPFMPFLTEVLWQELKDANLVKEPLLMVTKWPK
ncbi:MAG TPA: valine--tRNA ligase [Patescibacteria group bacterium]|jgi:valyl-tRNA synthetase|nr:valine--tRNA ligase [Patescibacteria group bacterium]